MKFLNSHKGSHNLEYPKFNKFRLIVIFNNHEYRINDSYLDRYSHNELSLAEASLRNT